jgi:hypothetical protein
LERSEQVALMMGCDREQISAEIEGRSQAPPFEIGCRQEGGLGDLQVVTRRARTVLVSRRQSRVRAGGQHIPRMLETST